MLEARTRSRVDHDDNLRPIARRTDDNLVEEIARDLPRDRTGPAAHTPGRTQLAAPRAICAARARRTPSGHHTDRDGVRDLCCSAARRPEYGRGVSSLAASLSSPVSPIDRWSLDPAIVHLNHGSFGGCPRAVTRAAAAWRDRLEAAPMRFMVLDWQIELDRARAALAAFVHAPPERLVFVPGSTTGIAIALGSAALDAGDHIVTIDQEYRASMNQLKRLAAARGATITAVRVPMPFDAQALIDAVARAITPRTRLALFDHITSPTALCLPIEALVARMTARGIQVVVDGAHAPGQVALDVAAIGATWYIGNCHKWLCAPKEIGRAHV